MAQRFYRLPMLLLAGWLLMPALGQAQTVLYVTDTGINTVQQVTSGSTSGGTTFAYVALLPQKD